MQTSLLQCVFRLGLAIFVTIHQVYAQEEYVISVRDLSSSLTDVPVTSMAVGPSGRLWMATEGEGLFYIEGSGVNRAEGTEGMLVTSFTFSNDAVIFSSDAGIFLYRPYPGILKRIRGPLGLETQLFSLRDKEVVAADPDAGLFSLEMGSFSFSEEWPIPHVSSLGCYEQQVWVMNDSGRFFIRSAKGKWAEALDSEKERALSSCMLPEAVVNSIEERNADLSFSEATVATAQGSCWWSWQFPYLIRAELSDKETERFETGIGQPLMLLAAMDGEAILTEEGLSIPNSAEAISTKPLGVVFDLYHYPAKGGKWLTATETGLYALVDGDWMALNLPVEDRFSFALAGRDSALWAAVGEEVLFTTDLLQWERYRVGRISDMLIEEDGAIWLHTYSGDLLEWDGTTKPILKDEEAGDHPFVGLLSLDQQVGWMSSDGLFHLLRSGNKQKWNLKNDLDVGELIRIDAHGEMLALLFDKACIMGKWKDEAWQYSRSLIEGIDYPQTDLAPVISLRRDSMHMVFDQARLSWPLPDKKMQIEKPRISAIETGLPSDSSLFLPGWLPKVTSLNLPFHSSYLRLHPFLPIQLDDRRYTIRFDLEDAKGRLIGEREVDDVLFPRLRPGKYTLRLQATERFGENRSAPLEIGIRVTPPFWQTWWFLTGMILLIAGGAWLWLRLRWRRMQERNRQEAELSRLEAMALRLQMNPHFIFNALDSISNFIFRNKQEEAVRYLSSFARLIRNTLESANEHHIPLRNEVDILRSYLELERMRMSERLTFKIHCDEFLQDAFLIPPMIVQPYVENAIKHGLRPKKGEGKVTVEFQKQGEMLRVEIDDDGIGRKASQQQKAKLQGMIKGKSMSMGITAQRLELLNKNRDQQVRVVVEDKVDADGKACGTRVVLWLPLLEDEGF